MNAREVVIGLAVVAIVALLRALVLYRRRLDPWAPSPMPWAVSGVLLLTVVAAVSVVTAPAPPP